MTYFPGSSRKEASAFVVNLGMVARMSLCLVKRAARQLAAM